MNSVASRILTAVERSPGISTADLSVVTHGVRRQQLVNEECRYLERAGKLIRRKRQDGVIGNYLPLRLV